jgi:hypothetical protein
MRFKIGICFFILAFAAACAKPPLAEMDSAREAVFSAENDADAVKYGGSSLTRAQDALKLMQDAADSKRYDAAKTHALEAIAAAEKAVENGRSGAVRAREEAASLLSGLAGEIEDTSRNVNGARSSMLDLDYNALDEELRNAYAVKGQAETDNAEGRYDDASDKARIVHTELSDINQSISGAITRSK